MPPSHTTIAQASAKGSALLFAGQVLYTIITAISLIVLARLLGPSRYGLYTLALVIPGVFQLVTGLGMNTAVTRFAAYYSSKGRLEDAKRFVKNAILFQVVLASVLTIVCLSLASFLSGVLLQRQGLAAYVQLASGLVIGQAIFNIAFASTLGLSAMKLSSGAWVLQSILKLAGSVGLVLAGFGVLGAIAGHLGSYALAGLAIVVLLWGKFSTKGDTKGGLLSDVREMMHFGLPAYGATVASGISVYFVTILLAAIATNEFVGYYQVALNVTVPIALVSSSIAYSLMPAFASLAGIQGRTSVAFAYATKYSSYVLAPTIFILILLAHPLVLVLLGPGYSPSAGFLVLLAASSLPVLFGQTVSAAYFNGVGATRLTLISAISGLITMVVLAPVLGILAGFGIDGLIYSMAASNVMVTIVSLRLAHISLGAEIDRRSASLVLLASLGSYTAVSVGAMAFPSSYVVIVAEAILFLALYLSVLPLIRGITMTDLEVLSTTVSALAPVRILVTPVIRYERFLLSITNRKR